MHNRHSTVYKILNHKQVVPWVLIAPMLLLFLAFYIWPMIDSFHLSFYNIRGERKSFVGLGNYVRLIQDPMFWKSIWNMLVIFALNVPLMLLIAIVLATLLNSAMLRFKSMFRVLIFLPAVTSLVAYSMIFFMMLNYEGILNSLFKALGLSPQYWLDHPVLAKISIVFAITWRWSGYNMIIFLAALQNVPQSLYEAATIDGASKRQQFFHITIPQLKPVILFTGILSTIGTLQLFDEPMNLTGKGGPGDATLSATVYLYKEGFVSGNIGYAATIAWGLVAIVGLIALLQFKLLGRGEA